MRRSRETASRFRQAILSGTWIANTNYRQELSGLEFQIAVTRIEPLNTIALLAQHIHYYIAGINQVFEGGTLDIRDAYSFDFPAVNSQEQWETFLNKFWDDAETFADHVEKMTDEQLDDVFADVKFGTYQRNIDAMIEHSYYHLGQIVLIRKMLSTMS